MGLVALVFDPERRTTQQRQPVQEGELWCEEDGERSDVSALRCQTFVNADAPSGVDPKDNTAEDQQSSEQTSHVCSFIGRKPRSPGLHSHMYSRMSDTPRGNPSSLRESFPTVAVSRASRRSALS